MTIWKTAALALAAATISDASSPATGRDNLGLYGGNVMSSTWDDGSKRLFASVAGPLSLFASDDTGRTWSPAYPTDSLKWMEGSDMRGWAGRGINVWSRGGTTICRSVEEGGVLWAVTLSTDGRNFRTVWDEILIRRFRDDFRSKSGKDVFPGGIHTMGIGESAIFAGADGGVFLSTDTAKSWRFLPFPDTAGALEQDRQKKWSVQHVLAGRSDLSRILVVASPPGNAGGAVVSGTGSLWQTTDTGKTFSRVALFDSLKGDTVRPASISSLMALPNSPDSVLLINSPPQELVAKDSAPPAAMYLSADGGATWTKFLQDSAMKPGAPPNPNRLQVGTIQVYQDSTLPGPDGIRLISGTSYSDDLGKTWTRLAAANGEIGQVTGIVGHVAGSDIWFARTDLGPATSRTGIGAGTYEIGTEGMVSLTITRVAQLESNLDRVYLATNSGLAFTSAYTDTSVKGADKWKAPHGKFPIVFDLSGSVADVAIDPWDSLHVVAATGNGMWYTTNGGMSKNDWTAVPFNSIPGWHDWCWVRDIRFSSKDTIFAATKGDQVNDGGLLASYDGGKHWSTVTGIGNRPVNSVTVASNGTAKVIYVGTGKGSVPGYLFRSANGGATWDTIPGLDARNNPGRKQLPVRDVEPRPGSVDTIFIAGGDNTDWAVGWSFDRGDSIQVPGPRAGGAEISRIAVNKHNPDSVYFAMRNSIVLLDLSGAPMELPPIVGPVDSSKIVPPDTTKPLETVTFQMNWFVGYPGEILYDIHYDELMMASSVGAFGVRGQAQPVSSVRSKSTTLAGLRVVSNSTRVRLGFPNPTGREMRVEIYDLRGKKVFQGLAGAPVRGNSELSVSRSRLGRGSFIVRAATNFSQTNRLISLP